MKEAKAEYAKLQQQEKSCLLAYCLAMVAVTTVALKFPVAEVSVIGDFSPTVLSFRSTTPFELPPILTLLKRGLNAWTARRKQGDSMKRVLRIFLWGLIIVAGLGGVLFGYFVYSPAPAVPQLSGHVHQGDY